MSIRLKLWIQTLIPILFIAVFGIVSMLWITYSQQRKLINETLISNINQLENELNFAANNFEKTLVNHVNKPQFISPARALFKITDSVIGLKKTFQCEAITQLQQLIRNKEFDTVALYDLSSIVSYAFKDKIYITAEGSGEHYTPTAASVFQQCSTIEWEQTKPPAKLPKKTDDPSKQSIEFSVDDGVLTLTGVIPITERVFNNGEETLSSLGAILLKQNLTHDFMEKFSQKTSLIGDIFSLTGQHLMGSHSGKIKVLPADLKEKFNGKLSGEISFEGNDYFMMIRTYYHHGKPAFLMASYSPEDIVISNSKHVFFLQVAGLVVGVIIATLIALFTGRFIAVPIRNITEQMNWIADEKRFDSRVEIDSQDELGKLAEAFNKMATMLEIRDSEISGYVNELDEMNKLLTERGKSLEKTVEGSENKYRTLSDQLTALIKGTASDTGEEFFRSLVKNLAEALNVRYAFVGVLNEGSSNEIRTLALWGRQTFMDNITCNAFDNPCETTLKNKTSFFPDKAQSRFPNAYYLKKWKIQSYLGARLLNSSGKVTGVLVVMDDKPMDNTTNAESIITIFSARAGAEVERLFSTNKLNDYAKELERSNTELTNFALIASHDLSEPLRKVMAFGDRLRNRLASADEKSIDDINRMQSATVRMQQLIDDLLSYAKVTIKAQPFQETDFNQVVKEALLSLEGSISASKGIVNFEALPTVEADPVQIRQLFQNLIGNALKYCKEGVIPVVNISSQPASDNKINIFIKDNGIGFEQEYEDRVFGLFQRLHGRSEYPGTGMGLAICKKIVERHGGTLKAKSALGKGSTFIITLPVKQIRLN